VVVIKKRINVVKNRFVTDNYQALLVDHRGHGESNLDFSPPHTVQSCTDDVRLLVETLLRNGELMNEPNVVIGHSFGGKVALKYREQSEKPILSWILDAAPGPINPELFDTDNQRESVVRLKKVLRTLPPWKTKAQLVKALTDANFSLMVAQWMTTNVVTKQDGSLEFAFNLDIIDTLFDDYCKLNMFPSLSNRDLHKPVHFLRAGRNKMMWTEQVLSNFDHNVDKETVFLHTMLKAGHFLHAEDPEGVYNIIVKTL
jgi:pimeloyl-ACP methyl ester carboxylesterase